MRQITGEAGSIWPRSITTSVPRKRDAGGVRRRLDWLNDERMRVLNAMEAKRGAPLKPSQSSMASSVPCCAWADERRWRHHLPAPAWSHADRASEFIRAFFAHEYSEVMDRNKALFKALPDVPKAEIVWRFHFMLGALPTPLPVPMRCLVRRGRLAANRGSRSRPPGSTAWCRA
jgi:hypothetical protein